VVDYDVDGAIVGIEIDQAQRRLDLNDLTIKKLPFHADKITA
jgi:uncharacterized protein YuzE